jgi:hypothetical protein
MRHQGGGGPNLSEDRLAEMETVYSAIVGWHIRTGIPPTVRDVCDVTLLARTVVRNYIKCLIRRDRLQSLRVYQGLMSTNPFHTSHGLLRAYMRGGRRRSGAIDGLRMASESGLLANDWDVRLPRPPVA